MTALSKKSESKAMSAEGDAPVRVTAAESAFVQDLWKSVTLLPSKTREARLESAAEGIGLTKSQALFVRRWLETHGDPVLMAEDASFSPRQCVRYMSSPLVFKLLEEASRVLKNMPSPVLSKDELALTWSMISRDPGTPESYQKEARQELSKLLGYYQGVQSDSVNVGVQVVLKGGLDG